VKPCLGKELLDHVTQDMVLTVKRTIAIFLCLATIAGLSCSRMSAQSNSQPTMTELLRILRITTRRIRVPNHPDYVWDIQVLNSTLVKPQGTNPQGLTTATWLLSMRDKGHDVYEFTLPERNGAFSQGDFELCKEVACAGQYSLKWLKQPLYSADGTQCLLAEFSNLGDEGSTAYIALIRVHNKP
jgi:hypothetical protein